MLYLGGKSVRGVTHNSIKNTRNYKELHNSIDNNNNYYFYCDGLYNV